jgi:hypothetical protein
MLDNLDIAVLTKVNQLAEQHGLRPYDFVATFKCADAERGQYRLHFEIPSQGNTLREERFDQMLTAIAIDPASGMISGSPAAIIDVLDSALQVAPRKHGRF